MTFLGKLLSPLLIPFLDWVYGKVMDLISKYVAYNRDKQEIEEKNRKILEMTERAKTEEEIMRVAEEVRRSF